MEETSLHSLSFAFNEESGMLHALYNPAAGASLVDMALFQAALTKDGWDQFHLDDAAIQEFVTDCRGTDHPLDKIIGVRRDGEFSLTVDDDLMTAWLTLVPPQGGRPVTPEAIKNALVQQGIMTGINRANIDAACAVGHCERVVIACGQPVREGVATRFETLYEKRGQTSEDGGLDRIRYADLCHILLVNPGDKLMRRVPPVQGNNGINIMGHPILPKPMPDIPFRSDLQGAAPDQNDPNLLVAISGGQPILMDNGVMVNPMIEVQDVDLSTGSIEFEGTLRVSGDVKAGMRIKVSGDVIVNGAMEAAQITAGGNVVIGGGIVGPPDSRPGMQSLLATTARILCEGSVQAMFMENVHVEAGKSIMINRHSLHCELIAREEIIVGNGAKTGQIIGGRTQATLRVVTGTLGAPSGIKTYVQAGIDSYLEKQVADKEQEYERMCDEVDRIAKLLVFFKDNPDKGAGGVAEKVEATRQQVLANIDVLAAELEALRAKVALAEQACVEVQGQIHYGAEVRIGQQMWQAPDDMGSATLRLQDGRVAVNR